MKNTDKVSKSKKMINQYKVLSTLGKGSFAEVCLCYDTNTGEKYAVKKMNKRELKSKRVNG